MKKAKYFPLLLGIVLLFMVQLGAAPLFGQEKTSPPIPAKTEKPAPSAGDIPPPARQRFTCNQSACGQSEGNKSSAAENTRRRKEEARRYLCSVILISCRR